MAGRQVPVILVPRFTSFVGPGNYDMSPIPVSAYESLTLTLYVGQFLGTGVNFNVSVKQSNDLNEWVDASGTVLIPASGAEATSKVTFDRAWLKFTVHLTGTNPGVTTWAQGFLELREK